VVVIPRNDKGWNFKSCQYRKKATDIGVIPAACPFAVQPGVHVVNKVSSQDHQIQSAAGREGVCFVNEAIQESGGTWQSAGSLRCQAFHGGCNLVTELCHVKITGESQVQGRTAVPEYGHGAGTFDNSVDQQIEHPDGPA
jgi:hypothetical protein